MKESQFGFKYSWTDLKPIRALTVSVAVGQILGAVIGWATLNFSDWFLCVWVGGATATLPSFIVGAFIQSRMRPGSLTENSVMVRRFGLIALLFFIVALVMLLKGG